MHTFLKGHRYYIETLIPSLKYLDKSSMEIWSSQGIGHYTKLSPTCHTLHHPNWDAQPQILPNDLT